MSIGKKFDNAISFFKPGKTTDYIVYGSNSCEKSGILSEKSKADDIEILQRASAILKADIHNFVSPYPSWPPSANVLIESEFELPERLSYFLTSLFEKRSKPSDRVKRIVSSLGQDIIYNSSRGLLKTQKHTQLGLIIKRQTGSRHIIDICNRLGHCISYHEVNEIETAVANEMVATQIFTSYVPTNVQLSRFVTFVYDNCDHNPETLNGESMHCTNGILIQPAAIQKDKLLSMTDTTATAGRLSRSFTPIVKELLPYYSQAVKSDPSSITDVDREEDKIIQLLSRKDDFVWLLSRYYGRAATQHQKVPGWTGFNYEINNNAEQGHDAIHYLPAIEGSPTKMDVIQEILIQIKSKAEAIGLTSADAVFDHAIYAKALEVINNPTHIDLKRFINLRMGGFHACCIFIAVIGKRFGSAGLKDMILEAGLIGEGSIESALRGKHYNRSMRLLKTTYEALQRLKLDAFENWLLSEQKAQHLYEFLESNSFEDLADERSAMSMQNAVEDSSIVLDLWLEFEEKINSFSLGPMAVFWSSFLDMVEVLLDYVKSFRTGNWELNLQSMERMLKWFHAYDHVNYARHFTYYWATQKNLQRDFPTIFREFRNGHFSVKRSKGNFNGLPPDQVIEQTINKDQKGAGGIIGFSTSPGTVQRWVLSSHVIAGVKAKFKTKLGLDVDKNTQKDLSIKRIIHDEESVISCYELIRSWNNPFEESNVLVGLSSGRAAPADIQTDLLNAPEIGSDKLNGFIATRIHSNAVSFYASIQKNKLKTFSHLDACPISISSSIIALKSDRELFARLLVLQEQRGISMREILKFELAALPLSLAKHDGTLAKTVKSKMFLALKDQIPVLTSHKRNSVHIYDGMVLLQKIPPVLTTFGELSDYILQKATKGSARISYFVTDQYLHDSIKSQERERRLASQPLRVIIKRREQKLPKQFKKFLRSSENKMDLLDFLVKDWSVTTPEQLQIMGNNEIFITVRGETFCFKVSNGIIQKDNCPALESEQEEADTKMFLCCQHAKTLGISFVNIVSVDADVGILGLYYQRHLDLTLSLEYGTGSKMILFNLSGTTITQDISDALPGLYGILGCDSCSCFVGKGKIKGLLILQANDKFQDAFKLIGEERQLSQTTKDVLEEFVCCLYGMEKETSINEARYQIFSKSKSIPDPERLPPTRDALMLHLDRVNFQAFEWKHALENLPRASPVGHGWKMTDGSLQIDWMHEKPAPDALLGLVRCKCKKNKCQANTCDCFALGYVCTSACSCKQCNNDEVNVSNDDEDNGDEDDLELEQDLESDFDLSESESVEDF